MTSKPAPSIIMPTGSCRCRGCRPDGADHHLALLRRRWREQRAQDEHAGLHGVGRQQHFRNEQDAVRKSSPTMRMPSTSARSAPCRAPSRASRMLVPSLDLFLQPVIETSCIYCTVVVESRKDDRRRTLLPAQLLVEYGPPAPFQSAGGDYCKSRELNQASARRSGSPFHRSGAFRSSSFCSCGRKSFQNGWMMTPNLQDLLGVSSPPCAWQDRRARAPASAASKSGLA